MAKRKSNDDILLDITLDCNRTWGVPQSVRLVLDDWGISSAEFDELMIRARRRGPDREAARRRVEQIYNEVSDRLTAIKAV